MHRMACVFYETKPLIYQKFGGTSKDNDIHERFYRGYLDKQLNEKIRTMDKDPSEVGRWGGDCWLSRYPICPARSPLL